MEKWFLIFAMFFVIFSSSAFAQGESYYGEDYENVIAKHFVRYQEYPKEADLYGLEGGVIVQIQINQKGELLGYKFLKKSGYDILDAAVVRTILKSQPYPKIPASYLSGSDDAEFIFPIVFGDNEKMLMEIDEMFQREVKKARNK